MRSALALLALAACAHTSGETTWFGRQDEVQLVDALPSFERGLVASAKNVPDGPMAVFTADEEQHRALYNAAGAYEPDPGDAQLRKLAVSPEAVAALADAFDPAARAELKTLVDDVEEKFLGAPRATFVFSVLRASGSTFEGSFHNAPLYVLNARSTALLQPDARRLYFARALFRALHAERHPDSPSLGPVARRLYREGATLLAVRQLLPRALEDDLLGLDAPALQRLKNRQAVLAKELLAALDSNSEAEAARFFDPRVKDPLLPSGSGLFLADQLYQRLAAELGSATRPLDLDPGEFARRARKLLLELSQK